MSRTTALKSAILEDETVKVIITEQGTITSLYNKKTQTEFIHSASPTGWRMITSLGAWYEHPIFDYANTGELLQNKNQVEVKFDSLTGSQNDRLAIQLTLIFKLADKSGVIEMRAVIANNSNETVRELMFPFISGFAKIPGAGSDALVLPHEMGLIMDKPLENLPVAFNYGVRPRPGGNFFAMEFWPHYPLPYPGVACMPWLDFFNEEQGVYMGYHDHGTPTTAILARKSNTEDTFQLGFSRYPFVAPGEDDVLGDYMVFLHPGDWHQGAKLFKKFAQTKVKTADSPEWIAKIPGVHFSFHIGQNRQIKEVYDTLLEKFHHNQTLGLNLPLFVFGWTKTGFDNCYPEYEPDPRLGGTAKLKSVIKEITSQGGQVILYTQGRLIDKGTAYYKKTGRKASLKNECGVEYIDEYSFNDQGTLYPGKLFALGCPSSEEWYRQLKKQIDTVMDLGATGILFDQIAGDVPFLCFDRHHHHSKADRAFEGKIALLNKLQQYAASKDPQFIIMSELICDVYLQCVDLTHGMATARLDNSKPVRFLPEMYRYSFPKHRITSRNAKTIKEYNQAFALGFIFEYHCRLPQLDYLESLLKLRVELERFFVKGAFLDTDGLSYQPVDLFIKVYATDNREEKAIMVANESLEALQPKISVSRTSEEWQMINPHDGKPVTLKTPIQDALTLDLEPAGLRVIIVK